MHLAQSCRASHQCTPFPRSACPCSNHLVTVGLDGWYINPPGAPGRVPPGLPCSAMQRAWLGPSSQPHGCTPLFPAPAGSAVNPFTTAADYGTDWVQVCREGAIRLASALACRPPHLPCRMAVPPSVSLHSA